MSEKYTQQLAELATELVTPERFGGVQQVAQLMLPELARIYELLPTEQEK